MRLIDADALYAKVQEGEELARKRVLDTETTLPCPTNLNPAYTRYLAQMDERTKLKHMIADAPTVEPQQWIPCTERLPEKHTHVLVYSKTSGVCIDFINNVGNWYGTPRVLAWIPLPKPWEGGDPNGS